MTSPPDKPARQRIPETPQDRLKRYRLDRFVTTLPKLPPTRGDVHFDPDRGDVKQFYVRVPVQSLEDLKLWMGYPNDHYTRPTQQESASGGAVPVRQTGVSPGLVDETVVAAAERHVLFGYADDSLLGDPFWGGIVNGLLERVKDIPILVAEDLVVPDGTTATIANTPTAFFHRVTIYGTGSIRFLSDCKLIADTFEIIPNPPVPDGPGTTTTGINR